VIATATEIWSYRGLIGNLARRELSSKYKKSVLGWLWSLLNPALTLGIYAVVFGTFLGQAPPVAGNGHLKSFALYLFAALAVWNFFNAVLQGSMAALTGAGPLLKKVYFPPSCPAIANSLTALYQAGIEAAILAGVMIAFGNVSWTFLLYPVLLVLLLAFSLGLGLVLSIGNVYFRDVGYLVGIGLQMLFYGTPMIYGLDAVPGRMGGLPMRSIIEWSPLSQFVAASRSLFYGLELPPTSTLVYLAIVPAVVLVLGWWIFEKTSGDVVEEL
jgi:ABC-2 type transport system permease protein